MRMIPEERTDLLPSKGDGFLEPSNCRYTRLRETYCVIL